MQHQYCYDLVGKAGRTWVTGDRVGMAYDRHNALKNEAAYARHYKYMATMPLLHDTHLPLAELRTNYPQTNRLKFAYIMGIHALGHACMRLQR